jgi:signal transduction histidine kinase
MEREIHAEGNQLVMRIGREIPPDCQAYQGELAKWLANLAKPAYVMDAQAKITSPSPQSDLAQIMRREGIQSWMFIPIHIQGEFFGVFNVCYTRPQAFGERDLRLFQALVQRASLAIENAQLYENAQELAVIKERNRLARDLHDSVKQKTFAALAQIGASRRLVIDQPERARSYMGEAENLVHDVLQELVTLIQEMYPLNLQENGLDEALRSYITQWSRQTGIKADLRLNGGKRLPHGTELALYRIFQEALANIARHSQAECVQIDLVFDGDAKGAASDLIADETVHLVIRDDGCGFDSENVQAGVGLRSMRERVENLGGVLQINSHPGLGTNIEVAVSSYEKEYS